MDEPGFVDRLRRGEEAAWRAFLEAHGGLIYSVATRAGLAGADRDDLFQETCVTCLRSLHTLRDPRRLGSWVFSVAYHLAIDLQRRRRLTRPGESGGEGDGTVELSDPAPDALAELERLERVAELRDGVAALEPRCRRLLSLLYLEDPTPSYVEISLRAEMPIGSIGPTRTRCLEKLRDLIQGLSNGTPSSSIRRSRAREESGCGDSNPPPAGPRGPDRAGC